MLFLKLFLQCMLFWAFTTITREAYYIILEIEYYRACFANTLFVRLNTGVS